MSLHLAEIATMVSPGRHAVLLLDQAGWYLPAGLDVPPNITLLPLPAKCPELNVRENVWQFMRDNWLSNRIFTAYNDIVAHCCERGTPSSPSLGASCQSDCAIGRVGTELWDLVLQGDGSVLSVDSCDRGTNFKVNILLCVKLRRA